MSITGLPGQGPVRVGIPIADLCAGLFCAMGILTALHEREVSGEGQHVATSLLQAQIFMLDFQASRWLQNQEVAKQAGNDHPTSIPTGVFKTTDGHINIATTGGPIWERFCRALGAPRDAARIPTTPPASCARRTARCSTRRSAPTLRRSSSAEWIDIFNKAGVPCGPIYNIDQVFADPQVKHLGIAQSTPKKDGSPLSLVGQPMTLSRTPSKMAARPPALGEHTDEVLKEFGFSAKRNRRAAASQGGLTPRRSDGDHDMNQPAAATCPDAKSVRRQQDAVAQGRPRRLRDLQQCREAQRGVARHVGGRGRHPRRFQERPEHHRRGGDRRGRQGVRVGRRHLEVREGALRRRGGRSATTPSSRRATPPSTSSPSRPSR